MLSTSPVSGIMYGRAPYKTGILNAKNDPTAGPNTPHYEIIFGGGRYLGAADSSSLPATRNFVSINTAVITSKTVGSIAMTSPSIWVDPLVTLNYMDSDYEFYVMSQAIKEVLRIAKSPPLAPYISGAWPPLENANTSELLTEYIKGYVIPSWHGAGTAAIGKWGTKDGVVNPDLTVKGVANLRIVDSSVFPFLISAPTQAGVYAIAERASDLIKAAHC
ncbi:aryl-alcohol oxidase [Clavulina sp. PMI_390]|nr:aryl-alcohol oxidase [Clavulina sp. PMI_390]